MEADHFVITRHEPVWRRSAGSNNQHSVAYYELASEDLPAVLVVTGYNIMSDDSFMIRLAADYPDVLIVFNSQVGMRTPGSEDRNGPGWRIVLSDDDDRSPLDVPFDALAAAGLSLY